METCKFCSTKLNENNIGYSSELDNDEFSRMKELKLSKNENICVDCKKELMFAQLIAVL